MVSANVVHLKYFAMENINNSLFPLFFIAIKVSWHKISELHTTIVHVFVESVVWRCCYATQWAIRIWQSGFIFKGYSTATYQTCNINFIDNWIQKTLSGFGWIKYWCIPFAKIFSSSARILCYEVHINIKC